MKTDELTAPPILQVTSDSIQDTAVEKDLVGASGAELSVVVPTFNESENVVPLVEALDQALRGISFEVVFVDDNSPDGTAHAVKQLARHRPDVRCIHRIGRRGLSSAVVEGILASSATYVAVIDGDMQHDERALRPMLELLQADRADLVVGSRYSEGGSIGDWTASRAWMSDLAGRLSRSVLRGNTLADPMSGFFMTRRELFESTIPALSIEGFKVLLDFVASSGRVLRIAEVPYQFRNRLRGESKLDSLVLWEYGVLLLDKLVGHIVPPRFVLFMLVGATGLVMHFAVLSALWQLAGVGFLRSQAAASLAAMTWNFVLNDLLTYRDKRLKGMRWWRGLASFYAVCGLGALANVGIARVLFHSDYRWWLAAGAGIVVGTIFNYGMTSIFTWKRK